jgi:oligopeptide transport system ATP-binding protein
MSKRRNRQQNEAKRKHMSNDDVLLEVKNLKKHFPITRGIFSQHEVGAIKAVDGVSFHVKRGETVGLVGESGCGKTTTGRCVLQLHRPTSGEVIFEGLDLCQLPDGQLQPLRRKMQIIFQDPYGSLNPRMTAGAIVAEPVIIHKLASSKKEREERVKELFQVVGLNPDMTDRYPHEFSGGQRQRIGIARALAGKPSFVVADEPVSALDVSIQAQVINLLEALQERFHLTFLFIAHDLAVVRHISNRILVMYLGKIVEVAAWEELYENPLHPYTKALLSAVPIPDPLAEANRELIVLTGDVPSPANPPSGCSFHPRCPYTMPMCKELTPQPKEMGNGHVAACHLY